MTQQPETQIDVLSGPLTPGVERLTQGGWASVDVPRTRVAARRPVVLVGPGGILVIGTHKTSDAALAELGSRVTALVPQRFRGTVLIENGHDRQSLPALAETLEDRLDGADVHAGVDALGGLATGDGLLTVEEFLERTRDAARHAADELKASRVVRCTNFVARNALSIALLVTLLFLSAAISTGTDHARAATTGASTSQAASDVEGDRTSHADELSADDTHGPRSGSLGEQR